METKLKYKVMFFSAWRQGEHILCGLRARKGVFLLPSTSPISWLGHRPRINMEDGKEGNLPPLKKFKKGGKTCSTNILWE